MEAYSAVIDTPVSDVRLGVMVQDGCLAAIDFLHDDSADESPAILTDSFDAAVVAHVVEQLQGYFVDPQTRFDVPLLSQGTEFQQRVWRAMQMIKPGDTETYGRLAQRLGSSARAVGNACGANPVPIIVPCHRVVAVGGLGGFMGHRDGWQMALKRWLLAHEGDAR